MPRTKNYDVLRAEVLAREGAQERVARLRQLTLADMALYDLRRSREISQAEVAERLRITQSAVSKFENADDCLLSTLDGYVRALGGRLELRVWFDDDAADDATDAASGGQSSEDVSRIVAAWDAAAPGQFTGPESRAS